jgi:hypothetical protein
MVRPFQNAQILAFWFSEWKVLTVWRYFFGRFLTKNRVNFKKLFLENKKFGIWEILRQNTEFSAKSSPSRKSEKTLANLVYF